MAHFLRHRGSGAVKQFSMRQKSHITYSCAISGMSKETMKMDGRDSAECKNWEMRDKIGIIEIVKLDNKTKK